MKDNGNNMYKNNLFNYQSIDSKLVDNTVKSQDVNFNINNNLNNNVNDNDNISQEKSLDNVKANKPKPLSGKQELLLKQLKRFYGDKKNMQKLLDIIDPINNSSLSLRLIECFAVNYSNEYNTIYNLEEYKDKIMKLENKGKSIKKKRTNVKSYDNYFKVYNSYKSQLNEVSKRNFDTFSRGAKIKYYYDTDKYVMTTIGQLNFFKWAIENYVLEYIKDYKDEIKCYMDKNNKVKNESHKKQKTSLDDENNDKPKSINKSLSNQKNQKIKQSVRKKRNVISKPGHKSLVNYNLGTSFKFE